MLDLDQYFCTNPECKDYGRRGLGNISVNCQYGKHNRYLLRCKTCKKRFSETKCTAFFGSKYPPETIEAIIKAVAEGNGVRATSRMLDLDKDAVNRVILKAGEHCERMLADLLHSLQLTEIQLDELWSFVQKKRRIRTRP